MMMKDDNYIYLIGSENQGYAGFTTEKKLAKEFIKNRPSFKYVKLKKDSDEIKRLNNSFSSSHDEIVSNAYGRKYLMFSYEEEYFLDSFMDYLTSDIPSTIKSLMSAIYILKFDEDEKPFVNVLIRILESYIFDIEHGLIDEGIDHYFDFDVAADLFVKNHLEI